MIKKIYVCLLLVSSLLKCANEKADMLCALADTAIKHESFIVRKESLNKLLQLKQSLSLEERDEVLRALDHDNNTPFRSAISAIYSLDHAAYRAHKNYFDRVIAELIPACKSNELYAQKVAEQILHRDAAIKKMGAQAYYGATEEEKQKIGERFYHQSRGHLIEPFLIKADSLKNVLAQLVMPGIESSGANKYRLLQVLIYLAGPISGRAHEFTPEILNELLYRAALKECSFPSIMPLLLEKGAKPLVQAFNRRKDSVPIRVTTERFKKLSSDACDVTLLSHHLHYMLKNAHINSEHYDQSLELQKDLGEFAQKCDVMLYKDHWNLWLQICYFLGADVSTFRKKILCVVKDFDEKNETEQHYFKEFMNDTNLFNKFVLACVTNEFLQIISSSIAGDHVYNIAHYLINGDLLKADERTYQKFSSMAEAYFNEFALELKRLILAEVDQALSAPSSSNS